MWYSRDKRFPFILGILLISLKEKKIYTDCYDVDIYNEKIERKINKKKKTVYG